jgi:hypothetical protein
MFAAVRIAGALTVPAILVAAGPASASELSFSFARLDTEDISGDRQAGEAGLELPRPPRTTAWPR